MMGTENARAIWLLRSGDSKKYMHLVGWGGKHSDYWHKNFAAERMLEDSELPKLEVLGKSKKLGDFVGWMLQAPLVSVRAREALEPILGKDVQFVDFHDLRGKPYFGINVLRVESGYLDLEHSECVNREDGKVSVCYRYAFKNNLPQCLPPIFKTHPQSSVFVTSTFAETIIENKLTGFCLQNPAENAISLMAKGMPLNAYPGLL